MQDKSGECFSEGGRPVKAVYRPDDIQGLDYEKQLGDPGHYPYTRGIYPDMYRYRLWQSQQLVGFGRGADSRERTRFLLEKGETDVAFWILTDFPTLLGYDPDDPMAEGEVGRVGVSLPSLRELEELMEGLPLDSLTMGITTNATSLPIMSMFAALAGKRDMPLNRLKGACQNDILKEYEISGAAVYPPRHGLRLQTDVVEFIARNMPAWTPFSTTTYFLRESGCNIGQELAFTLANAVTYVESARRRGVSVDDLGQTMSFYVWIGTDVLEEVAKMRAMRRMWARIMKERFGARNPKAIMPRFGISTGGSILTAQQPLNNIVRVTLTMLAGALGGCQTATMMCYDEGHEIPGEEAQKIALRTQQIVAYESGVANTVDPLAGSYYVEATTNELEKEAAVYLEKIDALGDGDIVEGVMKGIETGLFQQEIAESAYRFQKDTEAGRRVVVGVNRFTEDAEPDIAVFKPPSEAPFKIIEELNKLRRERDNRKVKQLLARVEEVAQSDENLMPATVEAVKAGATLGEVCGIFRRVFGTYSG